MKTINKKLKAGIKKEMLIIKIVAEINKIENRKIVEKIPTYMGNLEKWD